MNETASKVSPPTPASGQGATGQSPLATGLIAGFAAVTLAIHLITAAITPYGIHRDAFLYLAMGHHLRFWRMDFPPAIGVLANVSTALFGHSLFGVRFLPAIAGTLIIALTGLMARELGGGRLAQGLSMGAVLSCPLFLRTATLFQPVVFDQLWWTLGFYALIKIAQAPRSRWWLLLGAAEGLGLLTKFSIGFFALGVLLGILLWRERAVLGTRWPYLAVLTALVIGSASIVGQVRLGFPVVIWMHDLQVHQLYRLTYGDFLFGQALQLGPALVLAGAGLVFLLRAEAMRPYRVVGWTCLGAFMLLMLLHGKAYYIGPIYPALLAAGAVGLESLAVAPRRIVLGFLIPILIVWGIAVLPFGVPILPPAPMARYAAAVGIKAAVTTNSGTQLALPQDYADMLGWKEQVAAVARAWKQLPAAQRAQTMLIARNYGEAGALEFYGPQYGLRQRILMPDNYLLWPPPTNGTCNVVVTIGIPVRDLARGFRSVRLVETYDNPWRVNEERHVPICVASSPFRNLIYEAWPRLKR